MVAQVYLECAISDLDGDPDNTLKPKEGFTCAVLQAAYIVLLASPVHVAVIFTSRPEVSIQGSKPWTSCLRSSLLLNPRTDSSPTFEPLRGKTTTLHFPPFASVWALFTYILLVHYVVQGAYLLSHYLHAGRLCARTAINRVVSKVLYDFYIIECRLILLLSFFLLFLQVHECVRAPRTSLQLLSFLPPLTLASPRLCTSAQLLWLCSAAAVNPDYVVGALSVIGSILSLKFVALFTAQKV